MTLKRLLFLLVGLCVLALAMKWQRDDVPPEQASPSPALLAQVPSASSPILAPPAEAERPHSAASAAAESRPPLDASRLQREIQMAVSSQERGRAGEAARHIESCQYAERRGESLRAELEAERQRAPAAGFGEAIAHLEQMQTACQAVDAASRAQWVPLLRRSLAEGDRGAAASLVGALGRQFDPAAERDAMTALRRDAWACDIASVRAMNSLATQHASWLNANEQGALREVERSRSVLAHLPADTPAAKVTRDRLIARLRPPPEADPAEVTRIAADIQRRCEAAR
jgi:hypothetical protein